MSVSQPLPHPIQIWEEDQSEYVTPVDSYIITIPETPKKEKKKVEKEYNYSGRKLFFPRK